MKTKYEKKRQSPRVPVNIEVEWQGLFGKQKGTITEMSQLGCFILCSGEVIDGETIRATISTLPNGNVDLTGEVVHHQHDIGFGIRFSGLNAKGKSFLREYVGSLVKESLKPSDQKMF